jgi:D-arabinose 1-dehydrogenase-like Zn-dependent alcohol dehydrogenase
MLPSIPKTYQAAVAETKGAFLKIFDVELKPPGPGEVLVKVLACSVCYSDVSVAEGCLGDILHRVLGHEIVGDAMQVGDGDGVTRFTEGERVGGPWHGGNGKENISLP